MASSIPVFPGVSGCISLSVEIVNLLLTSKSNKQEHRSLQSAVQNINVFLKALSDDVITPEGSQVLGEQQQAVLACCCCAECAAVAGPACCA